jgi:hypothetical protein
MTTQAPLLYAVLDPARAPEIYPVMRALAPDNQCLFGNLAPEVSQVSPHVMALPEGGKLLTWWRAAGRGQAWGIACRTAIGLDGLRVHLKKFTRARLPDSSLVLFRFWDPRVLSTYLQVASPAERARFFGPINAIYADNAEGESQAWHPPEPAIEPTRGEVRISPAQDDALTRANLFARLLAFLRERVAHPEYRALLVRQADVMAVWERFWPSLRTFPEYVVVIALTYALALETSGQAAASIIEACLAQPDPDYVMKDALARAGIVRFSEFDL